MNVGMKVRAFVTVMLSAIILFAGLLVFGDKIPTVEWIQDDFRLVLKSPFLILNTSTNAWHYFRFDGFIIWAIKSMVGIEGQSLLGLFSIYCVIAYLGAVLLFLRVRNYEEVSFSILAALAFVAFFLSFFWH